MTKKDYELIAEPFKTEITRLGLLSRLKVTTLLQDELHHTMKLINDMARVLAKADPKFDRNKFLEACGILEYVRSDIDEETGDELITYRPVKAVEARDMSMQNYFDNLIDEKLARD